MSFKEDFARFSGLTTLPGLPPKTEGQKADSYDEGRSAGDAVVAALEKGWAKPPKESTKKAWMPIVDKYAGVQEFVRDPEWTRGFRSALIGYYGKPVTLEDVSADGEETAVDEQAFHHGTVRQWQNGRHMKNGASWERIKTGRTQGSASKVPTVLDVVQGNAPPESLGPPIAAMPALGVVGASVGESTDLTVSEALDALNAQLQGEEGFDENVMKKVFGVLRKLGGSAPAAKPKPKAHVAMPSFSQQLAKQRQARERKAALRDRE